MGQHRLQSRSDSKRFQRHGPCAEPPPPRSTSDEPAGDATGTRGAVAQRDAEAGSDRSGGNDWRRPGGSQSGSDLGLASPGARRKILRRRSHAVADAGAPFCEGVASVVGQCPRSGQSFADPCRGAGYCLQAPACARGRQANPSHRQSLVGGADASLPAVHRESPDQQLSFICPCANAHLARRARDLPVRSLAQVASVSRCRRQHRGYARADIPPSAASRIG